MYTGCSLEQKNIEQPSIGIYSGIIGPTLSPEGMLRVPIERLVKKNIKTHGIPCVFLLHMQLLLLLFSLHVSTLARQNLIKENN